MTSLSRAFVVGFLLLAACSRPSTPSKDVVIPSGEPEGAGAPAAEVPGTTSASNSPPGDDCERLFGPPANARKLCDEHDNAVDSELHWQSFASTESRVDVNRRYQEWAARCQLGFVTKPPIFSVTKGPTRLSTHEAAPVDYPTCEKKPSPEEKTVIVVSTMLRH